MVCCSITYLLSFSIDNLDVPTLSTEFGSIHQHPSTIQQVSTTRLRRPSKPINHRLCWEPSCWASPATAPTAAFVRPYMSRRHKACQDLDHLQIMPLWQDFHVLDLLININWIPGNQDSNFPQSNMQSSTFATGMCEPGWGTWSLNCRESTAQGQRLKILTIKRHSLNTSYGLYFSIPFTIHSGKGFLRWPRHLKVIQLSTHALISNCTSNTLEFLLLHQVRVVLDHSGTRKFIGFLTINLVHLILWQASGMRWFESDFNQWHFMTAYSSNSTSTWPRHTLFEGLSAVFHVSCTIFSCFKRKFSGGALWG